MIDASGADHSQEPSLSRIKSDLIGEVVPLKRFRNWDRQIEGFSQKRIFHEKAWLRFLAKDQGGEAVVVQITDCEGRQRALWPGLVVRKGPIRIFGSPLRGWGTVSMGPLFHEGDVSTLVQAAEKAFIDAGIRHWEFVSESLELMVGGKASGYRYEASDTHRIALHADDEIMWANLEKRCRTAVRKAAKSGLDCRVSADGRFLKSLYAFAVDVFARSKIAPPYDLARLQRLWDALFPLGKAVGFEVWMGEQMVSGGLMIADGRQAYVWSQASDKRFNQYGPNNLLHWEAMRYFAARGASYLHSPGAAGSSIGRFKESFRPEVLSYPFWIRDRSHVLRWGRALYQETYWIQSWYRYLITRQTRSRPDPDGKS